MLMGFFRITGMEKVLKVEVDEVLVKAHLVDTQKKRIFKGQIVTNLR